VVNGVEIPLTRGFVAIVDPEDAERVLAAGSWHVKPNGRVMYARREVQRQPRRWVLMHTFITGWPQTDHRDGDGLNNRRSNLRPATKAENGRNRRLHSNNTSGYRGVSRSRQRWFAQIKVDGRKVSLGMYADPVDAARAYDQAAREHFGEFARLNFPEV
jgi:hypothetical protein